MTQPIKNPLVEALECKTAAEMAEAKPLAFKLAAIADEVRKLSPTFAEAVDAFVGRLQNAEAGAEAPQIGEQLPEVLLPDQTGKLISLLSVLETGPALVTFLRGHWCPYCRLTAATLGELRDRVQARGGRIVAITPENRTYIRALEADSGGGFPILSDIDNGYALSLNLAVWVEASMAKLIAGAGWNIPQYNGDPSWTLPIPAAFVVDRGGIVRARFVNPDYRLRADYEAMADALAALE
ncbi:MAG TPA: peroxiredoxin [Alphaproteobacteria bacterium]|nr:peroxiredoxin [Alphaproteobacteria bacterium]HAJ48639.1 peroxiredoxin [Alphaproteobacteria bacterium]